MEPTAAIGGRFYLEEAAGAGGMGTVYRAIDEQTGRHVAVKLLNQNSGVELQRFQREAALLEQVRHPAVVGYVASGTTRYGESYLVMEWLGGGTLGERLARERLSPAASLGLVRTLAAGLAEVHALGIVHRDLKPSNVLFDDAGQPKLIDFGLARRRLQPGPTHTGMILGTPGYMSPEQVRAVTLIDARADIFSLGCLLHECLGGRPPFLGATFAAVQAKVLLCQPPRLPVAPPLAALVARMMAKDRDARPADAGVLVAELAAIDVDDAAVPAEVAQVDETPTWVIAAHIHGDTPPAALQERVSAFGVTLNRLSDDSVLLDVAGDAERAAALALCLRDTIPGVSVVLAGGPLADAIDRSMARLERAAARADGDVVVEADREAATALDTRFDVVTTSRGGRRLRGPRS